MTPNCSPQKKNQLFLLQPSDLLLVAANGLNKYDEKLGARELRLQSVGRSTEAENRVGKSGDELSRSWQKFSIKD